VNRWLALLVAIIAGGAFAFAAILGFVATLYGVLWIYVFGDDPWPPWVDRISNIGIPILGLALWAIAAWVIWRRLTGPRPAG
jgi:hypothetical protein